MLILGAEIKANRKRDKVTVRQVSLFPIRLHGQKNRKPRLSWNVNASQDTMRTG